MRLVILKPTDCPFDITNLLSKCLLEQAHILGIQNVVLVTSIEELQPNDLVLYRFSSDFHNGIYQNNELCHLELSKYIQQIENKGCIVYPSSYMLQFYENKKRMYELFEKNGIKYPKTFFVTQDTWKNHITEYKFPILLKHLFSCSSNGMKQIESFEELEHILPQEFSRSSEVLLQNKIIAKKEARISYYGESLYHGYYRIKNSVNDMSAATSFGSFCDYTIDLQKYKKTIHSLIYDLGISLGGVDILWENDDETTEPYVLEVSPIFEVNPPTPEGWTLPYKEWKVHPDFYAARIAVLEQTAKEYIQFALREYNKPRLYIDIDHTICNSQARILAHPNHYHLRKYVLQDTPFEKALDVIKLYRKTHTIYFLSARLSYEDPFLTTRDWLFSQNIQYKGLILVDNLPTKCNILSNLDKDITYIWIDDCTISDEEGGRMLHPEIPILAHKYKLQLYLINSEEDWTRFKPSSY